MKEKLKAQLKSREAIYRDKKVQMFDLRRKVMKQEQRSIFVANSENYMFKELQESMLCDEEKSKVFYEIKAALHIKI